MINSFTLELLFYYYFFKIAIEDDETKKKVIKEQQVIAIYLPHLCSISFENEEQCWKWNKIAHALIESLSRPFWWMIYRMRRRDLLLSYLFNLFFEHVNRFPYLYLYVCCLKMQMRRGAHTLMDNKTHRMARIPWWEFSQLFFPLLYDLYDFNSKLVLTLFRTK